MDKIRITSNNINEVKEIESKLQLYKLYKTMLLSAPSMDLKSTCDRLTMEINTILLEVTDFKILISIMEKNGQLIIELQDSKFESIHISMASGFQRLLFDLIFRIVLAKSIQASTPTFFIIDDCFGTGDSDHIKKITSALKTYKSGLDWILIIGQNEELMYCDSYISIAQHDEISKISHGELVAIETKTPTSTPTSPVSPSKSPFIMKDDKLYCVTCKKSYVVKTEAFKSRHIKSVSHLKLAK
jgi:DNA repair exonuclease SbcCD ATPase subunit